LARYKGYTQTSELTPTIRRFTVDNPTIRAPARSQVSACSSAARGTNSFIKGVAHFRYFYPFLKSQTLGTFVVSQGVTFGIGTNLENGTGGELPLYERFFPGGVGGPGDVRGYQLIHWARRYHIQPERHAAERSGHRRQQGIAVEQRDHIPDIVGLGIRGVIFADADKRSG